VGPHVRHWLRWWQCGRKDQMVAFGDADEVMIGG
jgi:hypothetical protein